MEFIQDVESLGEECFSDILFERLSRRLGEEDRIKLVPDPNSPQSVEKHAEQPAESTITATDTPALQRDEEGIPGSQAITVMATHEMGDNHSQPAARTTAGEATLECLTVLQENPTILERMYSDVISALYDTNTSKWKAWPTTNVPNKEREISEFLNELVAEACKSIDKRREEAGLEKLVPNVFYDKHANVPVKPKKGEYVGRRKPDIVLRAGGDAQSAQWNTIRSIISVKSRAASSVSEENGDLAEYVRLVFGSQKSRRFVLCATLFDTKLRLWKYDRSGPIVSCEFDAHEKPKEFLRIVLGLALGEDYFLGYDPSIIRKDGEEYITLNDVEYRILETMQLDAMIRGRGSAVFLVEDPVTKQKKIMKDQWVDVSRKTKEFEMLKDLTEKQVKNVATCEQHQIVHFQIGQGVIEKDTTLNDRDLDETRPLVYTLGVEIRDHYRLLISPYGERLEKFRSRKELVSAFRDFYKVIQELYEKDVVHRDISLRNVILVEIKGELERRGYVIDFDYAILQSRMEIAKGERTGTLPFMAIEIMDNPGIKHQYYHDAESIFYVLLWICLYQEGPNDKCRPEEELDGGYNPLYHWCPKRDVDEVQITTLSLAKTCMMETEKQFKSRILSKLPEYFTPLKPLLKDLRGIIFASDPDDLDNDAPEPSELETATKRELKSISKRDPKEVFEDIFRAFDRCLRGLSEEDIVETDAPQASSAQVKDTVADDDSGIFMCNNPLTDFGDMRYRNVAPPNEGALPEDSEGESYRGLLFQSSQISGSLGTKRSLDAVAHVSSSPKRPRLSMG